MKSSSELNLLWTLKILSQWLSMNNFAAVLPTAADADDDEVKLHAPSGIVKILCAACSTLLPCSTISLACCMSFAAAVSCCTACLYALPCTCLTMHYSNEVFHFLKLFALLASVCFLLQHWSGSCSNCCHDIGAAKAFACRQNICCLSSFWLSAPTNCLAVCLLTHIWPTAAADTAAFNSSCILQATIKIWCYVLGKWINQQKLQMCLLRIRSCLPLQLQTGSCNCLQIYFILREIDFESLQLLSYLSKVLHTNFGKRVLASKEDRHMPLFDICSNENEDAWQSNWLSTISAELLQIMCIKM